MDNCKARNETRRKWRVAFAAENTKAESFRTTKSINAQIEMSQEMVLDAIAMLRARQLEIYQSHDQPNSISDALKKLRISIESIRGDSKKSNCEGQQDSAQQCNGPSTQEQTRRQKRRQSMKDKRQHQKQQGQQKEPSMVPDEYLKQQD